MKFSLRFLSSGAVLAGIVEQGEQVPGIVVLDADGFEIVVYGFHIVLSDVGCALCFLRLIAF